jgi:molybdenum cofactor cytidylyltransferase
MIAGLILAAGESSRMKRDKALLTYRGRTFVETLTLNLRHAGIENIAVVLGHHAEEIKHAVNLAGVRVVLNPDYQRGQTSSLQAGITALEGLSPEGVVLCLVDHPAVSAEIIGTLKTRFERDRPPAVIPILNGQRGHPVLISHTLFAEILALPPGGGANTVLRKYRETTQFVEVEDRGILIDVDDPETYERLAEGSKQ